tara:strand:- start:32 stop:556 length:525 start_codon:yes stop_codon:yes gene_type:complete
MFAQKLGLMNPEHGSVATDVDGLIQELLGILQSTEIDMTIFFRALSQWDPVQHTDVMSSPLKAAYYSPQSVEAGHLGLIDDWLKRYTAIIKTQNHSNHERAKMMNQVNPRFVLRNYLAQLVIDESSEGKHRLLHEILEVLRHPYTEQPKYEHHAEKRPEWARHKPGCSMLSCSS